jgi:hypothetical protein
MYTELSEAAWEVQDEEEKEEMCLPPPKAVLTTLPARSFPVPQHEIPSILWDFLMIPSILWRALKNTT